jgi:hypothetical protein
MSGKPSAVDFSFRAQTDFSSPKSFDGLSLCCGASWVICAKISADHMVDQVGRALTFGLVSQYNMCTSTYFV